MKILGIAADIIRELFRGKKEFNKNLRYQYNNYFRNTPSGHRRLEKVTTSYDQTRRRHDVLQKTSDLRRLEDVRFTSS